MKPYSILHKSFFPFSITKASLITEFCEYLQLNLGIYMMDDKAEFSVLVDRAVGGASIQDGQLELMLHRFFESLYN
jgi:hypothetical protein